MTADADAEATAQLAALVRDWAAEAAGPAQPRAREAARLVPYGSACLPGVSRAQLGCRTDLDLLCLVPLPLSREAHFFGPPQPAARGACAPLAARLQAHGAVEDLVPIPLAFVPCIKLVFRAGCGEAIPVDLTFCALPIEALLASGFDAGVPPPAGGAAQEALRADPAGARSLAAVHTSRYIREAVRSADGFGGLYLAVRWWANRRGIHGGHLGFPRSVSWAVLCAAVCQRCPAETAAQLLRRFFAEYAAWPWPCPVQLREAEEGGAEECGDLMPILTPAAVATARINSCHSASPATFELVRRELAAGAAAAAASKSADARSWVECLFDGSGFFHSQRYGCFVALEVRCAESARWAALCESLLPGAAHILETTLGVPRNALHPFSTTLDDEMPRGEAGAGAALRRRVMFGVADWTGSIEPSRQEQAGAEFRQIALGKAGSLGTRWIRDEMTVVVSVLAPHEAANAADSSLSAWTSPRGADSAVELWVRRAVEEDRSRALADQLRRLRAQVAQTHTKSQGTAQISDSAGLLREEKLQAEVQRSKRLESELAAAERKIQAAEQKANAAERKACAAEKTARLAVQEASKSDAACLAAEEALRSAQALGRRVDSDAHGQGKGKGTAEVCISRRFRRAASVLRAWLGLASAASSSTSAGVSVALMFCTLAFASTTWLSAWRVELLTLAVLPLSIGVIWKRSPVGRSFDGDGDI